ncbi:hypothetical protein T4D_8738 [Trichinella pseudospiralis]|uniref:Uncharacterized protein n=1 Tax=Trichinella pseudospiralis TaxID=6337 RepID=A0A0V1FXJ7_TRIPS|nr:hypothetical protein T4D_8738 [Trichinella pseudospiralis]
MDPRISESLNWPSWIAAEKLLDHNDGQLAELAQGRHEITTNPVITCSTGRQAALNLTQPEKSKYCKKIPKLISLKNNRIRGRKNRTKLNTRTDRLVKTPNLSGMLPFYSYSANCVAHLQTGSHLDLLLHLASDSQSHSMAAPVLLQIVPKNSLLDDGDSFSITLKIPTEPTIW